MVAVGIFVVGAFTVSVNRNLSELGKDVAAIRAEFDIAMRERLTWVQEDADDRSELWRRIGYLEAKLEVLAGVAIPQ